MPITISRSGHTAAVRKIERSSTGPTGGTYTQAIRNTQHRKDKVTPFAEARHTAREHRRKLSECGDVSRTLAHQVGEDDLTCSTGVHSFASGTISLEAQEIEESLSFTGHFQKRISGLYNFALDQEQQDKRESALNKIVGAVIVLNTILMGIELDTGSDTRVFWFVVETIFIMIFLVELFLRVCWEGLAWVKSWWNWLDLFIVSLAMIDLWILAFVVGSVGLELLTLVRIVRLVRLVRVVRLMRMYRSVYVTVMSMKEALGGLFCIGSIGVIGLYVSAIFTTTTIGRSKSLKNVSVGNSTASDRFGSMPRSVLSLFELMTLEGWEGVWRPLVMRQPALALFLFFFIMVFTFGLMNMVVAVIVEKSTAQAMKVQDVGDVQKREEAMEELMEIRQIFQEMDEDPDGLISRKEFEHALEKPDVRTALQRMKIPVEQASVLYDILDGDGDGELTLDELLDGCARIGGANDPIWDSMATHALVRSILGHVRKISSQVDKMSVMRTKGCKQSQDLEQSTEANEDNSNRRSAVGLGSPWVAPYLLRTTQSAIPHSAGRSPRGSPRPPETSHGDLVRCFQRLELAQTAAQQELLARFDKLDQRLPFEVADNRRRTPGNSKSC